MTEEATKNELKDAAMTLLEQDHKFGIAMKLYRHCDGNPEFDTIGKPEVRYIIEYAETVHGMDGEGLSYPFLLGKLALLAGIDLSEEQCELVEALFSERDTAAILFAITRQRPAA